MPRPEIIGSAQIHLHAGSSPWFARRKRSTTTFRRRRLGAPELRAIHPLRPDAGAAPRRCRVVRIESHRHLSRSASLACVFPSDTYLAALTEQWVSVVNTMIDRTLIRTFLLAYIGPRRRRRARPCGDRGRHAGGARADWSSRPGGGETGYLVGDRFTFADINLLPILDRVRLAPEGAAALAAAPHLAAYYERHAARPSFVRTTPPAAPPGRARQD